MPRPVKSPMQRMQDVRDAHNALAVLLSKAEATAAAHGADAPETIRAWGAVEIHGATIHRQSRLLAGKSKGG